MRCHCPRFKRFASVVAIASPCRVLFFAPHKKTQSCFASFETIFFLLRLSLQHREPHDGHMNRLGPVRCDIGDSCIFMFGKKKKKTFKLVEKETTSPHSHARNRAYAIYTTYDLSPSNSGRRICGRRRWNCTAIHE